MSSGHKLDREDTTYAEQAHKLSMKNRNWLRHGSKTSAGKEHKLAVVKKDGVFRHDIEEMNGFEKTRK